jgi:shikimate kinase
MGINLDTNKSKNVILVGMTCSGKTSVGRSISEINHYSFLDTDEVIAEKESMSIDDIFTIKGEECFRKMESELINKLAKCERCIIATGGGLPIFYNNMDMLNKIGITVFLDVDVEIIIKRAVELGNRPLLKSNHREVLLKMSKDRAFFYKKADIIINDSYSNIETLSGIIIKKLEDYLKND